MVYYSKVLDQQLFEGTEGNHEKPQSVSSQRFELGTYGIRTRIIKYSTAIFRSLFLDRTRKKVTAVRYCGI
jgi:hypothetical protein